MLLLPEHVKTGVSYMNDCGAACVHYKGNLKNI